jgi:hypothetical protein
VLVLGTLVIAGCAQKDSPVGSNLAPGLSQALPAEMILPPADTRFYRTSSTTIVSTYLYLGHRDEGYRSNLLVRFNPIASVLPDNFMVDSLRVRMVVDSVTQIPNDSIKASVFLVNREQPWWNQSGGVTWNNFNSDTLQFGPSIGQLQVPATAVSGDTVRFLLSSADSLLRAWLAADSGDTSINHNNGLYFDGALNQDYMVRFSSTDHTSFLRRPQLEMFLTYPDSLGNTVSGVYYASANSDAFIANDTTPLSTDIEQVWLGNGAAYRTIMRFAIDDSFAVLPNAIVQRAEVIIRYDAANSLNNGTVAGAYGLPMTDTAWLSNPDSATTGPVSLPGISAFNATTGTLAMNVTALVNDWVQHPGTHQGVMIHSANEYENVARQAFYGFTVDVADTLRPYLRIVYVRGVSQ